MKTKTPQAFIQNLIQIYANLKRQPLYFAWCHPLAVQQTQSSRQMVVPAQVSWDYQFLCSTSPILRRDHTLGIPQPSPDMIVFEPGKPIYPIAVPQSAFIEFHRPTILPDLENFLVEGGYLYLLFEDVPLAVAMLEHPHSVELFKGMAQHLINAAVEQAKVTFQQQQQAAIKAIKDAFGETPSHE